MRLPSLSIYFLISQVVAAFTGPQRHVSKVDRLLSAVSQESATTSSNLQSLTLFSPCKINLFLRIIRKRPDGYHDLASLFQAIGFGDTLELSILGDDATEDEFTCNMPGVPVDSSNLVLRALALMREKTQVATYFKANLIKQVPAQAGLGGGSANAATALWGANQLMGEPATLEEMVEWSGALGSDITFFLSRGTAYCTGRGEIMSSIDPPLPSGTPVCIVKPNVGLSTPQVFKALEYDKLSTMDADQMLLPTFLKGIERVPDEMFINDLEFPAFKCLPELKLLKEELLQVEGFDHVMMSGSGTSIFCLGAPKDKAAFDNKFKSREDLQIFYSEFISRSEGQWFEAPRSSTS
ncbi:4-diphosphocytidyl-2-C-methyl-D-erythritol kinase [Fistulifera solaris]|uniref:4-(cytidine 5'-diphospho)-2-C-methyl-D-erythritol kinase n=1 Tax=Fistulifera solaris TaxID=1519565 RepID=A0A1Z5JN76_FISSO|nr:4-diphosphocytidyl-2-C-methyl-D-erythritol kinase [Fistulifera solaris]|eukprot:GAX15465.1 4-diphosphocytidyl-2-C-methyl-D-erythritol kinase [Fistulifera solaris]